MNMNPHDEIPEILARLRDTYNVPPRTPSEEMWASIAPRLKRSGVEGADADADVVILAEARKRRAGARSGPLPTHRVAGWAVAAAAALILGIGIGRLTAPDVPGPAGPASIASAVESPVSSTRLAAHAHLGEMESLLTMVRADARDGRVDPATAQWASGLLTQTRLLLDAQDDGSPAVNDLLLDLELLLVQIIGVAETGSADEARARTELELALRSLDQGEVLPRIQAVMPTGFSGA